MKTLYININGEDVQSTDSMIVIGDERDAIIDSFYIALGEEITAGSRVRGINHKAIVIDFAKDKPEEFEDILRQWEEVKEILLSDDPTGEYAIILSPEYLHWLRYNSNPAYIEVYEKKFVGLNEAKVVLDIDSLYKDSLATIRRKVFRFWESDNDSNDIKDFVINDECANGKSKLVRELREKLDIAYIRFNTFTSKERKKVTNDTEEKIHHEDVDLKHPDGDQKVESRTDVIKYIIIYEQSGDKYLCKFMNSKGEFTDEGYYIEDLEKPLFAIKENFLYLIRKTGLFPICNIEAHVSVQLDPTAHYCFIEYPDSFDIYDVSKDKTVYKGELSKNDIPVHDDYNSNIQLNLDILDISGYFCYGYDAWYDINCLKRITIPEFDFIYWIGNYNNTDFFAASKSNNWESVYIVDVNGNKCQRTLFNPMVNDRMEYDEGIKRWSVVDNELILQKDDRPSFEIDWDENGALNYFVKDGERNIESGIVPNISKSEFDIEGKHVKALSYPIFCVIEYSSSIYPKECYYHISGKYVGKSADNKEYKFLTYIYVKSESYRDKIFKQRMTKYQIYNYQDELLFEIEHQRSYLNCFEVVEL